MKLSVFRERGHFRPETPYKLLPFRFMPFDGSRYIVTNDVGEYVLLLRDELVQFCRHELSPDSPTYKTFKSRHFLYEPGTRSALDLLALKYRTRAERISWFTGLHIFVVTLRCDHSCRYCQVSRQTEDRTQYDMSFAHADKALELVFRSPSPELKIEFQGGEPLLRFDLVRYIVERALALNEHHKRRLHFVIASNLSKLTDDVLDFCQRYGVTLSTSLDGPEDLHNAQRPTPGGNSHAVTVSAIQRARAVLGVEAVSALMTTTEASLSRVEEIVDEYVTQGLSSIFLRNLSPYGFAVKQRLVKRYTVEGWVEFYKRGLARVLEHNYAGTQIREEYTAISLQKIFSPHSTGYVDLQSPAGIAIGALIYNYDGAVFASDEGRMLPEMNDQSFRLGHLAVDSYESMMLSDSLVSALMDTMPEGAPMCSDCAFVPYCGADPVFHQATQGDAVGHKAFSAFCSKQMAVVRHVIGLLEYDPKARDVLLGWV